MTTIETERLTLRPWRAEDFGPYRDYYADEENARYVGGRRRPDDAWRRLAMEIGHWELNGFGRWAVVEKESGSLVDSTGAEHEETFELLDYGPHRVHRHF